MKFKASIIIVLLALFTKQSAAEPAAGSAWTEPNTGMEFIWAPSGCFNMGSKLGTERSYPAERPVHQVCLKGFWIGKYEVTQAQYEMVMNSNPSAESNRGANHPVDSVTWEGSQRFAKELTINTGFTFALPTESQWEYSCLAGGAHSLYCGEGSWQELGWFEDNRTSNATAAVGKKRPNAWGLYDMSGNVTEWVEDCFSENYVGAPADGSVNKVEECTGHVSRGGSYEEDSKYFSLHAQARSAWKVGATLTRLGFRLIRLQ